LRFFFWYTKWAHLLGFCLNFETSWFQEGGKHEDAGWTELITCLLDLCVSSFPSFNPCVLPLSTFTAQPDDTTLFFIQASHSKVTVSLKKKWGENNLIHKSNASQVKWEKKVNDCYQRSAFLATSPAAGLRCCQGEFVKSERVSMTRMITESHFYPEKLLWTSLDKREGEIEVLCTDSAKLFTPGEPLAPLCEINTKYQST
jgi:hypothetical protein